VSRPGPWPPDPRPPDPRSPDPRPPALPRAVLGWSAERLGAPELAEDAAELFAERARTHGLPAARRWYRRQARAACARVLLARLLLVRGRTGGREGDGRRAWLAGLSLNARLGGRMLAKHPGVTAVGVLALAIGIGLGAGYVEIVRDFLHPTLPLPEGDRIVGLRNWDQAANDPEPRSLADYVVWRDELRTVHNVAAFRSIERNLGSDGAAAEPTFGAEMTASAFRVVRVPALLGRTLLDADERPGAPPVIVLGHDVWQSRFAGDAGVVGRTVRLGGTTATVAGVMPAGFAFPVSHHFWVPLRMHAPAYAPREGPAVQIFGRLAPGATLEQAQAELSALGQRSAASMPATHERLRPQVMKYTELFVGGEGSGARVAYAVVLLFVMLLLVLASNVATMMFARTATRENEIAMRYALGASRGQILMQFFVEALVLALAATVVALVVVAWGTRWVTGFFWQVTGGDVPFWLDGRLNFSTVLWALLLAVVGSFVAGVLPALRVTGVQLQSRIRGAAAAGDNLRFGGLWSAVIVVQVAFAVLLVPPAIIAISSWAEPARADAGFPTGEYLSARLELDSEQSALAPVSTLAVFGDDEAEAQLFNEFRTTYEEMRRRLLQRPDVSRLTFASRLPGMDHPQPWIEVDDEVGSAGGGSAGGGSADAGSSTWVMSAAVDTDFFDAFGAPIVAGRAFNAGDVEADARVVVVNDLFVSKVLHGRNAIGRRVRPVRSDAWHEIVGVVSGLGMDTDRDPFHSGTGPGVYFPLTRAAMDAGGAYAVRVAFHVRGDATSLAPELRDVARSVNPALRVYDVLPLDRPVDDANRNQRLVTRFFTSVTALVAVIALIISMAGTYSVLSFTVARQTREIGIRIALGADRMRIVRGVFSRAMVQIAIGIAAGAAVWFYVIVAALGGGDRIGLFLTAASVLLFVGAIACGVPVRRALRIEPVEALRDTG
jgi:putative ABC transport system permease protein